MFALCFSLLNILSMINYNELLNGISTDAKFREKDHLACADKLGERHGLLSTCSNWLFTLAVALGFPAVFTTSLLGYIPLGFAIIGCFLVWYRSRIDLPSAIEINMWFANRYWSFHNHCMSYLREGDLRQTDEHSSVNVILLKEEYDKIVEDANAWDAGKQTDVLIQFEAEQFERQRRSAAIGNRYNKHEIKQFI
jgi:hypothetical protein